MDIQTIFHNKRTILSTAVIAVTVGWYIKRAIKRSKEFDNPGFKEIPTPKGEYFYLGHLPYFQDQSALQVTKWHKELGPIFRIRMGAQHWVFIGEPEAAQNIFTTQGSITSGRPFITYGCKYHGEGERGIAFTDYGKSWKNTRTATLNILSPRIVNDLYHLISRETQFGVKLMIEQTSGKSVDPLAYTRLTAMNIILATVFGLEGASSIDDSLYQRLLENSEKNVVFLSLGSDISAYFPILSFLDVIFKKEAKMDSFVKTDTRPLIQGLIDRARKSEHSCLIKEFDQIKDEMGIDDQNIIATAYELIIGGVETVSLSMSWSFVILCHYPEWQKKMIDEIDKFLDTHGRLPLFTERGKLPNVVAFVKEAIRYRPAFLLGVPHKATEDVVYKDYVIPKGTAIFCNSHTTNNDPNFFKDPEKFNPERYLNDSRSIYASSNGNIKNRELFTFGWGRRICPGIYMNKL